MIFKVINPDTLIIEASYVAPEAVPLEGPLANMVHLSVSETLDADCVKAVRNGESIELVEDVEARAAKRARLAQEAIAEAYARLNNDVYAEAARVLGSTNPDSGNANQVAWKDMDASPVDYVGVRVRVGTSVFPKGHVFATAEEVASYAAERVSAVRAYGVWRENRIAAFEDERAAILAGGQA